MSNDSGGRWFQNPVPIVMVGLLTAGVLVKTVPLESGRPIDPDRMKSALMGHQDVEARLWQDPLAAIEKETSAKLSPSETSASPPHNFMALRKVITTELSKKDHTVAVLAVSVFGGSFDAGAEWRRRARFAVLSALGSQGYSPENPDALGYYITTLKNTDKELSDVQLTVPYEWFGKSMTSKVLVLWLDEDKLLSPYKNLISLFNELAPERTHAPALNFKLVGPAGSGALARLVGETPLPKSGHKPSRKILDGRGTLDIFSPTATISNCELYELVSALKTGAPRQTMQWNCFMMKTPIELKSISELPIVRTTLTDDVLSATLLWELWQRGVNRSHPWPVNEEAAHHKAKSTAGPLRACGDGIVLIHEWDTEYARTLSRSITEGVKELCKVESGKEPPVRGFTYLRGLDGVLPGMDKQDKIREKTREEEGGKPNDLRKQLEDTPPEHAEGRNQFDYLRRLVLEIERLDRDESFAKNGVRAIGILGSDVYDKLLILMALRNHFQNKIFFTTDLDARYLHADQKWARNLVVASNFGLELDPKLQKSSLPFRDTYQTAVYLAALVALEGEPIIGDEFVTVWTDTMKRLLRPMTFEVGRTEAVHLASPSVDDLKDWVNGLNPEGTLGTNGDYLPCSIENWKDCSGIQPQWPLHLALKQPGAIFIIIIFGIALIALASRYIQRTLRTAFDAHSPEHSAVRITLAGIIVAFLVISLALELIRRSINDSLKQGVGEPFIWLEGVSVWPSLTLRFISLILMVGLILAFTFRLKREANSISNDFGFKPPGSWVLARSRWLAAFAGPNFDLWAYDKDGKRTRNSIQRDGKKTEITTLWQNYLRATSWREKIGWVVLSTVIVFLFMKMTFVLFAPPTFPHRGQLVQDLNVYLVRLNVVILWGVIFWTSYEARACARLIEAVNKTSRPHVWSPLPVNSIEARFAGRTEDLADYLDFRLIARATQRIQWLIYLPFVSILFIVLARSDLFDAMDFPPPLIAVVVLSLCYAIYSEMLLRRCAVNARTQALKEYEDQLFALEGRGHNPAPAGTGGATSDTAEVIAVVNNAQADSTQSRISAEQIQFLMERIRNTHEGALAPFSQQPALQALLLPFGGYGGVQLIEYMMSLTQSG